VEATPALGLWNAGSYFRALEALVQGHGWEGLPSEFEGKEPDVGGVLTIAAQHDTHFMYFAWAQILGSKNARGTWKQVIVEGTGHDWKGMTHRIVEEVDKWLS
jgi:hypothetical protein